MKNIKKWDIYFAKLEGNGSVERGNRPVMVVSNDIGNELANTVCVIPLTSKVHKKPLPIHVYINDPILKKPSLALTEQIRVIDKTELSFKIGNIKINVDAVHFNPQSTIQRNEEISYREKLIMIHSFDS